MPNKAIFHSCHDRSGDINNEGKSASSDYSKFF